jgi:Fe-S cluster assembly protein SufD
MNQLASRSEGELLIGGDAERWVAGVAETDWTAGLRRSALARFRHLGLPTRRIEAWKYTEPATAVKAPTRLADRPAAAAVTPLLADAVQVVVANGFIASIGVAPAGVTIGRLSDPAVADLAHRYLGQVLDVQDKALAALNAAVFNDAVVIHVKRGAVVERPIELISTGLGDAEPAEFHPRCLVVVEEGGSAALIERHLGTGAYVSNSVVEIVLGVGASLGHCTLQQESAAAVHVGNVGLTLARDAVYTGTVLQVGGSLARRETHVLLDGPMASFQLDGAALASSSQHLDNTTFVVHRAVGGRSRQLFRTVLDETARGVFQGLVLVERTAQKTDAHQLSQSLLLSGTAEMDGKPALEIYADDVKCGHGASVGALDEAALFYLRSRGIGEDAAQHLLIEGFLAEVIDRASVPAVREAFSAVVSDRLLGVREKEVA